MSKDELELTKAYDVSTCSQPKVAFVFIHGLAASTSSFEQLFGFLDEHKEELQARLVAFDLLGSGKSRKDDALNYDYAEQLEALHNSIEKLGLSVPLVLVGHSMGTLIATRYAATYQGDISELVLISSPVYAKQDLDNPAFAKALTLFKDAVSVKNRKVLNEKSFNAYVENIILDRKNYDVLAKIKVPTTLIYGTNDRFIASYNLPGILNTNPDYLTAFHTAGRHGVTKDKFSQVLKTFIRIQNKITTEQDS